MCFTFRLISSNLKDKKQQAKTTSRNWISNNNYACNTQNSHLFKAVLLNVNFGSLPSIRRQPLVMAKFGENVDRLEFTTQLVPDGLK
jgi:hypothetical protein